MALAIVVFASGLISWGITHRAGDAFVAVLIAGLLMNMGLSVLSASEPVLTDNKFSVFVLSFVVVFVAPFPGAVHCRSPHSQS